MTISPRAASAMGLGLLGVAVVVSAAYAQQGDGAVRKTAGAGTATAPPASFPKAVVATIDLESVLRGYEKAKFLVDQLKAEGIAKEGQLKGVYTEAQQLAKELDALPPGTKDFKEREAKLTELKLKLQAGGETLKREQQAKYIEIMANSYKEAQVMTMRYATGKGITCVLKNNSEPVKSTDPDSVMAMMAQPVMYCDASLDITRSVLYNLNKEYTEAGGQIVKTPVGEATTDDSARPASAERPAPNRPAAPATGRPAAPRGGNGTGK